MPIPPGAAARLAAAKVLYAVLKSRRTLDDTLAVTPDFKALKGPDRAFARAMISAALRHLGRIDAVVMPIVTRPGKTLSPEVAALLRIGAAQLWVLDTPGHAAVGETVAAAKAWPVTQPASGLVNAVLRRAIDARANFDAVAAMGAWPGWLQADLRRSLGDGAAEALAEIQLEQPDLHLTVPRLTPARAQQLGGAEIVPGTVVVVPGDVGQLPGYEDGDWWVQDVAAALAVRVLAPQPKEVIFDLCAAPGGKTMQLAAAGAHVIAVDRSKPRLKRVRENLARTGLGEQVEVVAADLETWTPPRKADAILLDAPCSALGTLRRHPEGAWIKSSSDVARFSAIQARMLAATRDWLAPGGRLVYCVCTPRPQEGKDIVDAACGDQGWQRLPVLPEEAVGFETAITALGDLLTLRQPASAEAPFHHDAFFVSRVTRS
ncbi:MAG: transcription antitermination factor NusB [Pseudomonadota bacterium]